jgi:hypothetical protein
VLQLLKILFSVAVKLRVPSSQIPTASRLFYKMPFTAIFSLITTTKTALFKELN